MTRGPDFHVRVDAHLSAKPCPGCGEYVELFVPGKNIVLTPDAIWHEPCRVAAS